MRFSVSLKAREVSFSVPRKLHPLELVQGAAHVLSDRATAFVDETKTAWKLTLSAKTTEDQAGLMALGREFVDELHNQALRQRLIANSRPVYEHIVSRAVVSARRDPDDKDQPATGAELSKEQKAELEKLIAEAEAELAARRKTGVLAAVEKTWEERYGHPRTG
ncbi:MAG: hypothetical protein HYZ75_06895 [Elusimicrobia bacterium]|nr:hypothetical protein [Elusimicrobiota bacterium]